MKISISGERGEGKSTIAFILYKALVSAGYIVYNTIQGTKDRSAEELKRGDIIIEELFSSKE